MGTITIDESEVPAPDSGGELDRNNPDTYEDGDENGNSNIQV